MCTGTNKYPNSTGDAIQRQTGDTTSAVPAAPRGIQQPIDDFLRQLGVPPPPQRQRRQRSTKVSRIPIRAAASPRHSRIPRDGIDTTSRANGTLPITVARPQIDDTLRTLHEHRDEAVGMQSQHSSSQESHQPSSQPDIEQQPRKGKMEDLHDLYRLQMPSADAGIAVNRTATARHHRVHYMQQYVFCIVLLRRNSTYLA